MKNVSSPTTTLNDSSISTNAVTIPTTATVIKNSSGVDLGITFVGDPIAADATFTIGAITGLGGGQSVVARLLQNGSEIGTHAFGATGGGFAVSLGSVSSGDVIKATWQAPSGVTLNANQPVTVGVSDIDWGNR